MLEGPKVALGHDTWDTYDVLTTAAVPSTRPMLTDGWGGRRCGIESNPDAS